MYYQEYGRKYKNVRKDYKDVMYDSKLEANYAHTLDLMMKASDDRQRVVKWDRQVKLDLRVNGEHIANYYIDFIVEYADGHIEYAEVKGMETDVWKLKWKLTQAIYGKENPDIVFRVVK